MRKLWIHVGVAVFALCTSPATIIQGQPNRQVPMQGRVEYADGSPAKGAIVEAITKCSGTNVHFAYYARTDADGKFSIDKYDPTCNKYIFYASHREAYWLRTGDDSFYSASNGTTPTLELIRGKVPSPILIRLEQQGGEVEFRGFDEATKAFVSVEFSIRREPSATKTFAESLSTATSKDGTPYALFFPPGDYLARVEGFLCHGKNYIPAKPPSFRFSVKAGERQPLIMKVNITELEAKSSYDNPGARRCIP